jgi:hypothetical protein
MVEIAVRETLSPLPSLAGHDMSSRIAIRDKSRRTTDGLRRTPDTCPLLASDRQKTHFAKDDGAQAREYTHAGVQRANTVASCSNGYRHMRSGALTEHRPVNNSAKRLACQSACENQSQQPCTLRRRWPGSLFTSARCAGRGTYIPCILHWPHFRRALD